MRLRAGCVLGLVLAAGCAGTPVAPPAAPPAPVAATTAAVPAAAPTPAGDRPLGPPEAAEWVFGAVEATWKAEGERVTLYGAREKLGTKEPGTTTSYYLRMGGKVYGIHWDDATKLAALAPGATANLYLADFVACVEDPSHPVGTRCWRLMRLYPGRRAQAPLVPVR